MFPSYLLNINIRWDKERWLTHDHDEHWSWLLFSSVTERGIFFSWLFRDFHILQNNSQMSTQDGIRKYLGGQYTNTAEMPLKDLRELMKYNEAISYNHHLASQQRWTDFLLMCGAPLSLSLQLECSICFTVCVLWLNPGSQLMPKYNWLSVSLNIDSAVSLQWGQGSSRRLYNSEQCFNSAQCLLRA